MAVAKFILIFADLVDTGRIAGANEPNLLDCRLEAAVDGRRRDRGRMDPYVAFDLFVG